MTQRAQPRIWIEKITQDFLVYIGLSSRSNSGGGTSASADSADEEGEERWLVLKGKNERLDWFCVGKVTVAGKYHG